MKPAELRRSYEELVDAHRLLEAECARLREEVARLRRGGAPAEPEPAPKKETTSPGHIVDYVDGNGRVHKALVLTVVSDDLLELKVFRTAVPDKLVTAMRQTTEKQRNIWRTGR